jgi:hypothetical protein
MKYRIRTNGSTFVPEWSRWGFFWNTFAVQTGAESMGTWRATSAAEAEAYIEQQKANDRLHQWNTL